jgi:DnaJ-class molecular chaperone
MGPEELRSALGYKETPVDAQLTPPAPRVEEVPAARATRVDPVVCEAYATLGLRQGADTSDVKRAYRRLVRELHPDTNPHASTHERVHLSERFQRVTAAYRTLVA